MSDSYVGVTEASTPTGKLDAESLTVGANTVKRERVQITGAAATDIALVTAANGLDVDVTRIADGADVATGAVADAAATAGSTGTVSAKLRLATSQLDAIKTAAEIMDDWDESDRAKANIVVGQAGITAGAGVVAANTPRVTHASDDPVTTALQILDDWDESDRAKVNPIVGQAGVAAGAGAVAATVQRMTLASDDPAVAAVQIMDDWDESDRAKVNPIVGQAGVAAGAGAVGVTVQRTTLASDDPAVTALQIVDDWDESDRAKVNLIVGQAGIAAGAGAVGATVPRVTFASDAPEPTEPGDWISATCGGASVLAAAGDYAANDVLSDLAGAGLGSAWLFANAARASGGRGWIAHVSAYTAIAAFIPRLRVWFFSVNPTASELDDNSAFTIHANDLGKLIDFVDLPAMANVGGGSFSSNADARLRFELAATSLYAIVQILDAETDETAGMTFVLKAHVVQD